MEIDALRARRADRQRALRRRRRMAGALSLAIVAVVVIAVLVLGSGGSRRRNVLTIRSHGNSRAQSEPSRAPVRNGPPGHAAVPILMYHVIAPPPAGAPFPGLYVDPAEFSEQMQALSKAGWHAVTPDQVEAYWRHGRPLGQGKPIVISFDNGYQSQFTQGLPVLRRLGWVAEENIQLSGLPPSQGGLGEGEIRAMVKAGWELDTQGISHADLITLDAHELHEQVDGAREELRRRFHVPVNWFCYPSGHYDHTVVAEVEAAGYMGSTTVVPGWARRTEDPYRLPRLRVLRGTTGSQLLALLMAVRGDPPPAASYPAS
jgi:peptidoglycan/xylan/chitin deacetylase (PgdA/CDA1 family)